MKVSTLARGALRSYLLGTGLIIRIEPFSVRIQSDVDTLVDDIAVVYADFEIESANGFCDFHLQIFREGGLRRWFKPLARFYFDSRPSFVPLSASQAFTMFEWGLNWCIAAHCHQYLIIHAAVIEREGFAAIIPAPPGSGKSTLCAALIQRGWRLLSDELALLDMASMQLYGMARPVNLKNQSIELIQRFEPTASFSRIVPATTKGTIGLLKPPSESVRRVKESATPRWVIVPNYDPESGPVLVHRSPAETFMLIADQSFNYDVHGVRGFEAVGRLIDQCETYQFTYSKLEDAVEVFSEMVEALQ